MYCSKCGKQVNGGFCIFCGTPTQPSESSSPTPPPVLPHKVAPKKKSNKKTVITVLVVLVFMAIIGNLAKGGSATNTTSTTTPIANMMGTTILTTTILTTTIPTTTVSKDQALANKVALDIKTVQAITKAAQECGFDSISDLTPVADWSNGKRYQINYTSSHLVYLNKDGTLNSINMNNIKLWSAGKALHQLSEFSISLAQSVGMESASEHVITSMLKAPSTAKYPGKIFQADQWSVGINEKYPGYGFVSSYVDSQNSFGAMIRSNFNVAFKIGDDSYAPVYVYFEGKEVLNALPKAK